MSVANKLSVCDKWHKVLISVKGDNGLNFGSASIRTRAASREKYPTRLSFLTRRISINTRRSGSDRAVGVQISSFSSPQLASLAPRSESFHEGCGTGARARRSASSFDTEGSRSMLSYIFNMFIVKMCVLIRLPDLLHPPALFADYSLQRGQSKQGLLLCAVLPQGKSNSHRLNKETLQSNRIHLLCVRRRVAPNQVTLRRNTGNTGNDLHTCTAGADKNQQNIPPPLLQKWL